MIYQASYYVEGRYTQIDLPTMEQAVARVEEAGSGGVVTFRVEQGFNGPKHCSCDCRVFEDGVWRNVNIFGG
jgi:hypothetical protein